MKLLVFGKTGQVATELARVVGQGIESRFVGRDGCDLADPAACAALVETSEADVVINAAAYTAVDKAEEDEGLARLVNGDAPAAMARAAAVKNIPFIHVSTDYVFYGSGAEPFLPDSRTGPLGAYGRTKLAGEIGIRESGARAVILRTSWVFSAHGNNFVKTMLRLGREKDEVGVVADQIGGPTPAASIAQALLTIASSMHIGHKGGTFHFSGSPDTSWADFARAIMAEAKLDCVVRDIDTASYPTPAVRPGNSRLDCSSLEREFGIKRPDWCTHLVSIIEELHKDAA